MKMRVLGILSLALSLCLFNIADAQRGGQRGGGGAGGQRGGGGAGGQRGGGGAGGQRGGGFGGQRGGGGPQGAMQLIGLIRMEEVRKEIDLDDDTYEAMTDAVRDVMPDFRKMREMSEEERAEAGKKAETGMKDVMDEVLSPKQQDRLLGLLIQQAGYAAAANTLIAKKIDLDEDGIKKVSEAVAGSRTKLFEKMRASRGEGGGGERPDFSKIMEDMRKASDEAATEALSKAQIKQLDELKGEKFDFPERQFGGRGGPGGQGGAGGRPGQGGGQGGRGGRGGRPGQGGDDN